MNLTTPDFILIFIYFAVLVVIGYFASRKQEEDDFLIAKRGLGSWSTMATMNASKSGSIFMIFVAMTFVWGFSAVWYFIGVIFGALLFIPFALKLKENSKQKFYTLADYFRHNYGKGAAVIPSLITVFLMFGFLVLNLIAGTKIFVFFTGWAFWICASIMVVVVLIYLLLGGFKAVVKTDILQYIAMVVILVALTFIVFNGSIIPSADWEFLKVDLMTLVGFFIVGLIFPFASPDLWQRVYSSKGKKELRNGMLLSIFFYGLLAFLIALVALTVKAAFPGIDPDLALVHGFANLLPAGLVGLSVIFLFAAIMSSMDTYLFTGASSIVQDFFDWDKRRTIKNIKKIMFVLAILATLISILIQSLILGSYIFVAIEVVLGVAVIATWIRPRISRGTIVFMLIVGSIGFIGYLLKSISRGTIEIGIVTFTLEFTLIGLILGGFYSFVKQRL